MTFYKQIIFLLLFFTNFLMFGQDKEYVYDVFKDTRVINSHSVETLQKHQLDVRISHRFGDIAGDRGGWPNFYGLETAADVLIGADYGLTDNFTIGVNRTKGVGVLSRLVNLSAKHRLVRQVKDINPFSVTLLGEMSISTLQKSNDPNSILFFDVFSHRFIYNAQLLVATVIGERLTVQVSPGFVHRNIVDALDENMLYNVGLQAKYQFNKGFALIFDGTAIFSDTRSQEEGFHPPIGVGFEFDTGGHVFQINVTNATGLATTDYIPNTTGAWSDGEFRLGFTISRLFNL